MREAIGLYIHWPFCEKKCPYCDFNSHVPKENFIAKDYGAALIKEMAYFRDRFGKRRVKTIFFGGGTPSLMDPDICFDILEAARFYWDVAEDAEITLEANPSSAEKDRFFLYSQAGVNRLSLGVQALDEEALKALGRIHTLKEAYEAIVLGRSIFPAFSFDLIYARPNQSLAMWKKELYKALDLAGDHLSLYQLSIEKGTQFYTLYKKGDFILPQNEEAAKFYVLTEEIMAQNAMPAYEVSNFAKENAQSQHNLLYWRYQEYLGIGPGAHSRIFENPQAEKQQQRMAISLEYQPQNWLQKIQKTGQAIKYQEVLNREKQSDEMLLMGMRLFEGFDIAHYEELRGRKISQKNFEQLQKDGLIEMVNNNKIRATKKGFLVLNYIILTLVT